MRISRRVIAGGIHRYGPVDADLELFTISHEGLQIYFNPYMVGSGAEGKFVVHIPFRELVGLLNTNGPARSLLARQNLRAPGGRTLR